MITIGRRETATKHRSLSLWAPVIMEPSDLSLRSAMPRRSPAVFQRGISLIAAAICWASPASHASATSLYGLVVGINLYDLPGNNLDGAVSDAVDIAQALHKAGALDVKVLTDREATKDNIQAGWFDLVSRASPGDTIVFSYAGHGSQEPAPPGWHEPSGKSDNFILGGYQPEGPRSGERIVSYEVYRWLKAADDKGINTVFVADSCHSGTMYRSTGRAVRYRTGNFPVPNAESDLLPPPDPSLANLNQNLFRSVTFVGATQDDRLDPEVTIDGQIRGALSWAFSRGLEGAGDLNGDGQISQQELLAYIVPTVETLAEQQQTPSVLPLRAQTRAILPSARRGSTALISTPDQTLVRLFIEGGTPTNLPKIAGLAIVGDEKQADLIWNRKAGTVDHRIGGRVAEGIDDGNIAAVLSKWTALAFIKAAAAADPVTLALPTGNQVYKRGEEFDVTLTGARYPYLTMFNLPPDGHVEFYVPKDDAEKVTDWRAKPFLQRFRVQDPPFGAEHLVAILTEEPAVALHEALTQMSNTDQAAGLSALLSTVLAGRSFQAGVVAIYTKGDQIN
jgi:Caspase domain